MKQNATACQSCDSGLGGCRRRRRRRGGGGGLRGGVGPGHPGGLVFRRVGAVLTQGLLVPVVLKARLDLCRGPVVDLIVTSII